MAAWCADGADEGRKGTAPVRDSWYRCADDAVDGNNDDEEDEEGATEGPDGAVGAQTVECEEAIEDEAVEDLLYIQ